MKRLLVKIYDNENILLKTEDFIIKNFLNFDLAKSKFSAMLSLSNSDITKIDSSGIEELYNKLSEFDELDTRMDVIMLLDDIEFISITGIKNVNYSINDKSLIDSAGIAVMIEVINFIK